MKRSIVVAFWLGIVGGVDLVGHEGRRRARRSGSTAGATRTEPADPADGDDEPVPLAAGGGRAEQRRGGEHRGGGRGASLERPAIDRLMLWMTTLE